MGGYRSRLGGLGLLIGLLLAGEGEAALFCVVDFAGKQCLFGDVDSCRRAAGAQGGCVLNEAELVKPTGAAPFCLVESWRTDCIYMNRASCETRAQISRTVCMENPNQAGAVDEEPLAGGLERQPGGQTDRSGSLEPPRRANGSPYLPSPDYVPGINK